MWGALLLLTQFAFVSESWPLWDELCRKPTFIEGTPAPFDELMALHTLGVWGTVGEQIPTAAEANQACGNYRAYRQWLTGA